MFGAMESITVCSNSEKTVTVEILVQVLKTPVACHWKKCFDAWLVKYLNRCIKAKVWMLFCRHIVQGEDAGVHVLCVCIVLSIADIPKHRLHVCIGALSRVSMISIPVRPDQWLGEQRAASVRMTVASSCILLAAGLSLAQAQWWLNQARWIHL